MNKFKSAVNQRLDRDKATTYFVLFIFGWAIWSTFGAVRENYSLQQRVDDLEGQIRDLDLDNDRLTFSNQFYETDEYAEFAIRQELNKIAPGEKLFVGLEYDSQFSEEAAETENVAAKGVGSNINEWTKLLFGVDL